MKTSIGAAALMGALALLPARVASANDTFTLVDRSDHLEIQVRGALAAEGAAATARGQWIDVELALPPRKESHLATDNDRVVKRIDLTAGEHPRLSVLIHHDVMVAECAKNAVVEQRSGSLILRLPRNVMRPPAPFAGNIAVQLVVDHAAAERKPGAAKAAAPTPPKATPVTAAAPAHSPTPTLPKPGIGAAPSTDPRAPSASAALSPAPAASPAPAPSLAPAPVSASASSPSPATGSGSAVAPGTVAPTTATLAAAPLAVITRPPGPSALPLLDDRTGEGMGASAVYVSLIVLSLAGIAVLVLRRHKKNQPAPQALRIVSTCQLSQKVQATVVAVGDREVLLAVSDRGARVLARWRINKRGERQTLEVEDPTDVGGALGGAAPPTRESTRPGRRSRAAYSMRAAELPEIDVEVPRSVEPRESDAPVAAQSPAVAGLLKLRQSESEIDEDAPLSAIGKPVADDEWARQLLHAMRGSSEATR